MRAGRARRNRIAGFCVGVLTLGVCVTALAGCGDEQEGAVPADPQAAAGMKLAKSCTGCHSTDGSRRSGPTFKNLAGSQVQLADGSAVVADDTYLTRAIAEPDEQIVKGYSEGVMSAVVGPGKYTPEQQAQLVAYIKTVR